MRRLKRVLLKHTMGSSSHTGASTTMCGYLFWVGWFVKAGGYKVPHKSCKFSEHLAKNQKLEKNQGIKYPNVDHAVS